MADDAYKRFWGPQNEAEFQMFMALDPNVRAWRNGFRAKFGEAPDMDDPSFDYRLAFLSGNRPQAYEHDSVPHWDSRGKRSDHPTAWMEGYQQRFGVDPNVGPHSPAQQDVIRENMEQDFLKRLLRGDI